jgi:anti-anti-sigma factor
VSFDIMHGEQLDGCYRVNLWGEIDIQAARAGSEAVEGLRRSGCSEVVVGLCGVRMLDAAGTGFLADLHRIARDRGGRLLVRGPRPFVLRVLVLTRFREVIDVVP